MRDDWTKRTWDEILRGWSNCKKTYFGFERTWVRDLLVYLEEVNVITFVNILKSSLFWTWTPFPYLKYFIYKKLKRTWDVLFIFSVDHMVKDLDTLNKQTLTFWFYFLLSSSKLLSFGRRNNGCDASYKNYVSFFIAICVFTIIE
jgi:hypothetical protein